MIFPFIRNIFFEICPLFLKSVRIEVNGCGRPPPSRSPYLFSLPTAKSVLAGRRAQDMNDEQPIILRIDSSMRQEGSVSRLLADNVIANLHEAYNYLNKEITNEFKPNTLKDNYKKILIALIPVIPHFSNECLEMLKENKNVNWPAFDEKILEEKNTNIVVQVNGKKRGLIDTKKDTSEKELFELITKNKNIYKYIENKQIKKNIYIKNKLINIII